MRLDVFSLNVHQLIWKAFDEEVKSLGTAWRLISHFLEEQILCLAVTSQH